MRKEKVAEKICKTCAFCKQVYREFAYHIDDFDRFLCEAADGFTEPTDTCERWQKKVKDPPDLSSDRFDKAEEDIKALSKILID